MKTCIYKKENTEIKIPKAITNPALKSCTGSVMRSKSPTIRTVKKIIHRLERSKFFIILALSNKFLAKLIEIKSIPNYPERINRKENSESISYYINSK